MIRQSEGGLPQLCRPLYQVFDAAGTVEERERGVNVQVRKTFGLHSNHLLGKTRGSLSYDGRNTLLAPGAFAKQP